MQPETGNTHRERLNILVLFDQGSLHTKTTRDYLDSFGLFSGHNVYYAHATQEAPLGFSLDLFDAVLIHYSVRLCYTWHISSHFAVALERYRGLKVLFIQDEYENTQTAGDWMNKLGLDVVFSNVPPAYLRRIYPRVNHQRVEWKQALTGYAPLGIDSRPRPMAQRSVAIGYRVRQLPFRYGKLGWEKFFIGQQMRAICRQRNIPHDIEWTDDKRIFGDQWLEFLSNSRATLGSETGSNVFDYDGTLIPAIDAYLEANPGITFDQFFERFLKNYETEEIMNQISPRAFEAIAVRTALILFEGRYVDVLQPNVHYIPLKKDFSNIDEVLAKLQDDAFLEAMTERAYDHVIRSGRYTYERFVRDVMTVVEARVGQGKGHQFVSQVTAYVGPGGDLVRLKHDNLFRTPVDATKLPAVPRPVQVVFATAPQRRLWSSIEWAVQVAGPLLGRAHRVRIALRSLLGNRILRTTWLGGLFGRHPIRLGKELLKLSILRRFRRGPVPVPVPFRAVLEMNDAIVQIVSLPADEPFDGVAENVDWPALADALRSGHIKAIGWDHSRVGQKARYFKSAIPTADLYLDAGWVYSFDALLALARREPDRVVSLLRYGMGLDKDLLEASVVGESSSGYRPLRSRQPAETARSR